MPVLSFRMPTQLHDEGKASAAALLSGKAQDLAHLATVNARVEGEEAAQQVALAQDR